MTTILVIEDDESVLDNITDNLEAEGFRIVAENNGREGLISALEYIPDLIICDINIPEMDGYEVLYRVRNNNKLKVIPFVFLTAMSEREDMRRGMELGADDFITKPFTNDELIAAVETQLDKVGAVKEKLEATMSKLRQNIVYALPHELRTPLMQIVGFADLLRTTREPMSVDEIRMFGDSMWDGAQRINRLIENYLVYAQLEVISSDEQQIQRLRNNITPSIRAVIEERSISAAQRYSRIDDVVIKIKDQPLAMSPENLGKCIEELVDNACKFSQAGDNIEIKARKLDDELIICVLDRGIGMTNEQIKDVGAYMQFDRALREQQGLGLGLYITQKIVKLHAGTFSIKSKPEQGSLICMRFPN